MSFRFRFPKAVVVLVFPMCGRDCLNSWPLLPPPLLLLLPCMQRHSKLQV